MLKLMHIEKYLHNLVSSHTLAVETGCYIGIGRKNRL